MKPLFLAAAVCLSACATKSHKKMNVENHSFANYKEVTVTHLSLNLKADFDKKELWGTATLKINNTAGSKQLILDHKTLKVDHVAVDNKEVQFE
ncbi:MAG: hypothetical protein ACKO6I_07850, partial [Sphingomonadales bacterium]